MNFAKVTERIESCLLKMGKSKSDFYKDVGISSASMSQWRTGRYIPRMSKLNQIAAYLGTTTEWLITGEKEKPTAQQGSELDSPVAWATAWDQASPELRRAALAVLKSGEPSSEEQE